MEKCTVKDCPNEGRYCRKIGHVSVEVKAKRPIAMVSPKREEINRKQYGPAQRAFLKANPFCQVNMKGCTKIATQVHHTQGKASIELLLDQSKWVSICLSCHEKITKDSKEAIEQGHSKSRLKKEKV